MADTLDVTTLLMRVVEDDAGARQAVKDLEGIGGAAGVALRDIESLRGAFRGLGDSAAIRATVEAAVAIEREGIAARQAASNLALVSPVLRAMSAAQATAAADQQRFNAAVAATTQQITGKGLRQEVGAIAVAVREVGGASNIAGPQLAALGKRLADLERQGAKLPSDLRAIAKEASGLGAAFRDALSRALDPSAIATGIGQGIGQRLASLPLQAVQAGLDAVSGAASLAWSALEGVADLSERALRSAIEYDAEITKTLALTSANAAQVAQWSDELLKIGPATGKGPTELARALYFVASNGQTGAEALRIVEQSARASAAGMGETETIARAVTAAINAYGASNLSATQALDILTATVREGGAEASEYASSLGRVIGIAAQVGVSFAQVGGFMATFTRLGISGAEAATALRGTLTLLMHQSAQTRKALAELGLSVGQFKKLVADRGLAGGLVELVRIAESKGKGDALSSVIPNVRALAGVLATASAQGKEYVGVTDRIIASQGSAARAFDVTSGSLKQQLAVLEASGQSAAIMFGELLTPAAQTVVAAFAPLGQAALQIAQDLKANKEAQQLLKDAALALADAIRQATLALGEFLIGVGSIVSVAGPQIVAQMYAIGAATAAAAGNFTLAGELAAKGAKTLTDPTAAKNAETMGRALEGVGVRLAGAAIGAGTFGRAASQTAGATSTAAAGAKGYSGALGGVERDEKAAAEAARIHEQALSILGLTTNKQAKQFAELTNIVTRMGGSTALSDAAIRAAGDNLLKAAQSGEVLNPTLRAIVDRFLDMRIAAETAKQTAAAMTELAKAAAETKGAYQGLAVETLSWERAGAVAGQGLAAGMALVTRTLTGAAAVLPRLAQILAGVGAAGGFGNLGADQLARVTKDLRELMTTARETGSNVAGVGAALGSAIDAGLVKGAELAPVIVKVDNATKDWGASLQAVAALFQLLGITSDSFLGKFLGGLQGAIGGLGQMKAGLSDFLTKDFFKGGATGLINGITGALAAGSAALSIGKAILGLFHKSPAEKAAEEAGRVYGGKFSKAFGEEVAKLAKSLKIDFGTAALLSFDKAFAESGKPITAFTSQVRDLFGLLAKGGPIASKAVQQIGFAFTEAQKAAAAGDQAARKMMVTMIQQARAAGAAVPEIADAVRAGLDKAFNGLGALIKGVPIVSSADVDSQAVLLMSVFWGKVKEEGIVAAALAFGDIFKVWNDKLDKAGVEMSASAAAMLVPFNELARLASDDAVRPLLEGIQGGRDILNGLTDSGYATVGMFGALGQQAQSSFDALIAQGVNSQTALTAIAPLLGDLLSASQLYGVTLDDNTRALIDQAQAAGVAFPTDPMLQVVDLLASIATALGATLPESARRGGEALGKMGADGQRALGGLDASAAKTGDTISASIETGTASAAAFVSDFAATAVAGFDALGGAVVSAADLATGAWQTSASTIDASIAALDGRSITVDVGFLAGKFPEPDGLGFVPQAPHAGIGDVIAPRPGGSVRVLAEQGEPELAAPVKRFSQQLMQDFAAMMGTAQGGGGSAPVTVQLVVQRGALRTLIAEEVVDLKRAHRTDAR